MKKKGLLSAVLLFTANLLFAQSDCSSVTDPYGYCNVAAKTAGTVGNSCNLAVTSTGIVGTNNTCIGTCASTSQSYVYTVLVPTSQTSGAGKPVGPVTGFYATVTGGSIEKVVVTIGNDSKSNRTISNTGCSTSISGSCYEINTNLYVTQLNFTVHWTTASANNEIMIFLYSQQNRGNSNSYPPDYLTYYLSKFVNTYSGVPAQPPVINASSPNFSPCGWHLGTANMTDAYDYMWTVSGGTVLRNNSPYLESSSFGTGPVVASNQTIPSASVYTRNACGNSLTRTVTNIPIPTSQGCTGRISSSLQNGIGQQENSDPVVYAVPGTKTISVINTNQLKELLIYSLVGAQVKQVLLADKGRIDVPLANATAGVYFVKLCFKDGTTVTKKVFIQ